MRRGSYHEAFEKETKEQRRKSKFVGSRLFERPACRFYYVAA